MWRMKTHNKPRKCPTCSRCRFHRNRDIRVLHHKCPYKNCPCSNCLLVKKRSIIYRVQKNLDKHDENINRDVSCPSSGNIGSGCIGNPYVQSSISSVNIHDMTSRFNPCSSKEPYSNDVDKSTEKKIKTDCYDCSINSANGHSLDHTNYSYTGDNEYEQQYYIDENQREIYNSYNGLMNRTNGINCNYNPFVRNSNYDSTLQMTEHVFVNSHQYEQPNYQLNDTGMDDFCYFGYNINGRQFEYTDSNFDDGFLGAHNISSCENDS